MPQTPQADIPPPPEDSWACGISVPPEQEMSITDAELPVSGPGLDNQAFLQLLLPDIKRNIDADNVLSHAIECGQFETMLSLVKHGARPTENDLETAARSGHIPILAYLINYLSWHLDRVSNHGHTLLTLAIEHEVLVAWLLSHGADVNKEDAYCETPLSRAVEKGNRNVMDTLFEYGADVKRGAPLQASLLRKEGNTNLERTKDLLARGAPIDKFTGEGSQIWQSGLEQLTALHVACDGSHRNLAAIRLLLANGADPALNRRLQVPPGEVPGTSALESAQDRGYGDIVQAIRAHLEENGGIHRSVL